MSSSNDNKMDWEEVNPRKLKGELGVPILLKIQTQVLLQYKKNILHCPPSSHQEFTKAPFNSKTAMELIAQSGHALFQIITIGFQNRAPRVLCPLLYNSTTDKWTTVSAVRIPTTNFSERHHWTSALHNGVVYFTNNFGHHLGCYDIARGEFEFKEIEGGLPPQMDYYDGDKNLCASLPSLVACKGKLLLVGRLQKKVGEKSILGRFPFIEHTSVGIWELQYNKGCFWSLISITPHDLLQDTVKSSDGTDFMAAASSDKIWLIIKGSLNLMRLDLRSMEWSVLPGCPPEDLADYFPRRAVCGTFSLT